MRLGIAAFVGLVLVTATGAEVAGQAVRRGSVNWGQLAEAVVTKTWKLAPGERAVIVWEPSMDRGMAAALREAIARAGGVVTAELVFPSAAAGRAAAALSPKDQKIQEQRRQEAWGAVFRNADVAIWLPTPLDGLEGKPFEHLVERSKVRSIHFHWFLPSEGDVSSLEAMYARAIQVPSDRLDGLLGDLEGNLRGAKVQVTTPTGTNLSFTIPKNAWFHRNTGDASRRKVAKARSIRDREEELPASVLRTTMLSDADGVLVGNISFDTRSAQLMATFAKGRVVKLESKRGAEEIVRRWEQAKGQKDLPGEFVIGTNPELAATVGSGFMPYYGYGAGIVRVAIGDNWESGGKNRSDINETLFFMANATVTANGKTLVKDGKLVR